MFEDEEEEEEEVQTAAVSTKHKIKGKKKTDDADELCLQVLDTCDPSESFPRNRLDLVLTEVSAEREREGEREDIS